MSVLLVREDMYGLYTITNGGIYRPQESKHSYYHRLSVKESKLMAGGKYVGHHVAQSSFVLIGSEIWHWHGRSGQDSEKSWEGVANV